MPNTTCNAKKNIDRAARVGITRVNKLIDAQKKELELDLEDLKDVKQILKNIKMDDHSGSREFHHTQER